VSRSPHGRGTRALVGAAIGGIAGASALALLAAGCRAPARDVASRPSELHQEKSGPFVLETEIADPKIRAAALETLARASEVLEALYGDRPTRDLTIRLYPSETDRWVAEGVDPTARDYQPLPASASRASLRASVAFPRIEVVERRDALPDLLLCDSTRIALAHEAAHLWTFATIPGEENIPESIHEGIAEWVADHAERLREQGLEAHTSVVKPQIFEATEPSYWGDCYFPFSAAAIAAPEDRNGESVERVPNPKVSKPFLRESLGEWRLAREEDRLPTYQAWIKTPPRDSPSPQLWTVISWLAIANYLRDQDCVPAFRTWLRSICLGERLDSATNRLILRLKYPVAIEGFIERMASDVPRWWSLGRDVSELAGAPGLASGFLLSPVPGRAVWLFERKTRDCQRFQVDADVQILGGGSPELWVGFGFDDGRNGVRAVIPVSGKATVEGVTCGVPNYGFDASLSAGAVRNDRPFHVRVRRDNDEVALFVGFAPVTVRMPRGFDAKTGRIGIGARGGAFTVRDLRITVLPPRSK